MKISTTAAPLCQKRLLMVSVLWISNRQPPICVGNWHFYEHILINFLYATNPTVSIFLSEISLKIGWIRTTRRYNDIPKAISTCKRLKWSRSPTIAYSVDISIWCPNRFDHLNPCSEGKISVFFIIIRRSTTRTRYRIMLQRLNHSL